MRNPPTIKIMAGVFVVTAAALIGKDYLQGKFSEPSHPATPASALSVKQPCQPTAMRIGPNEIVLSRGCIQEAPSRPAAAPHPANEAAVVAAPR